MAEESSAADAATVLHVGGAHDPPRAEPQLGDTSCDELRVAALEQVFDMAELCKLVRKLLLGAMFGVKPAPLTKQVVSKRELEAEEARDADRLGEDGNSCCRAAAGDLRHEDR